VPRVSQGVSTFAQDPKLYGIVRLICRKNLSLILVGKSVFRFASSTLLPTSIVTSVHRLGIPRPRPGLIMRWAVPGGALGPVFVYDARKISGFQSTKKDRVGRTASLCGFFTVSSTLRIRHAASAALLMAFSFTKLGSQTNAFILSRTPSGPSTSTP